MPFTRTELSRVTIAPGAMTDATGQRHEERGVGEVVEGVEGAGGPFTPNPGVFFCSI